MRSEFPPQSWNDGMVEWWNGGFFRGQAPNLIIQEDNDEFRNTDL
jgi:hypothetical protein